VYGDADEPIDLDSIEIPDLSDFELDPDFEAHYDLLRTCREHVHQVHHQNPDLEILWIARKRKSKRAKPVKPAMFSSDAKVGKVLQQQLTWNIPMEISCLRPWADGGTIASDFCKERCYGKDWKQNKPETVERSEKNEIIRQRPDFAQLVIGAFAEIELRRIPRLGKVRQPDGNMEERIISAPPSLFRVHGIGDFDSERYIRAWIEIAKALRYTTFFAYTRSWRRPELRKALRELAALPNFHVLLSYDKRSGSPPLWKNAPTALLLDFDDRGPRARKDTRVVFRTQYFFVLQYGRVRNIPLPVMRKYDGRLVCPHEQRIKYDKGTGKALPPDVTCFDCKVCCPSLRM